MSNTFEGGVTRGYFLSIPSRQCRMLMGVALQLRVGVTLTQCAVCCSIRRLVDLEEAIMC